MKDELKILISRAKGFLEDARFDFEKGRYDLAMFHIEQFCQLILKAKLLEIKGYYPKTHSIAKLLYEIGNELGDERIEKFVKENKIDIRNIQEAYITSRYIPTEFFKEDVEKAFYIVEKIADMLGFKNLLLNQD